MRAVRGADELAEYLKSINQPISRSTIFRLVKLNKIPYNRIADRIIIFNLDAIDRWLIGESDIAN